MVIIVIIIIIIIVIRHLLQLLDVSVKLSPLLTKRKSESLRLHHKNKEHLTYNIETMGCQMNVADSERIEGQLRELGYTKSEDNSDSNIVIINTCSIRDHAEQKVYSYLGPYAQRKRNGEDVSIIIAGYYINSSINYNDNNDL